jgi:hypothetical protein
MSENFALCPNCGENQEGDIILSCAQCGNTICEVCAQICDECDNYFCDACIDDHNCN